MLNTIFERMNEEHPSWTKYLSRMVREAGLQERNRALTSGHSFLYQGSDGNLYERHSDGTETLVKERKSRRFNIKKRFKIV